MTKYKVIRWKREKVTSRLVFPVAIVWERRVPFLVKPTSALNIHFLWWAWGWWFVKDGDNDG